MGLFRKTPEEKAKKREKEKELDELLDWVETLESYPGSVSDYSRLKGEDYQEIDLKGPEKSFFIYSYMEDCDDERIELIRQLRREGCVALVHFQYSFDTCFDGGGVPVKRKL